MYGDNCFFINNCEMSNGGCLGNVECFYIGFGLSMCVCFFGYELNLDGINCELCINSNCYIYC